MDIRFLDIIAGLVWGIAAIVYIGAHDVKSAIPSFLLAVAHLRLSMTE